MEFKKIVFNLNFLYSFLPTKFLLKMSGINVIAPFYHTVIGNELNFVNHLYSAKNKQEFEKDLNYLLKHFKPIDANTLIKIKLGEQQNLSPCFFLSFDDGLSNFKSFIAPVLQKNKVPATIFLNSDFIDNKGLFYRYKINLLIDKVLKIELTEKLTDKILELIKTSKINKRDLIKWLKKCTHNEDVLLDKIAKLIGVSFKDFLKNKKPYLSSKQIEELLAKGFCFGAHSCSHPRYDLISYRQQLKQTVESVNSITNQFKIIEKLFSFPFSDVKVSSLFFNEMIKNNIITFGTSGLKDEVFETHFQRIPMEYSKKYSAKTIIKGELFYYMLKKMIGKNKIIRN